MVTIESASSVELHRSSVFIERQTIKREKGSVGAPSVHVNGINWVNALNPIDL
jgi:glutaredoxin